MIRDGPSVAVVTGFAKNDRLVDGSLDRSAVLSSLGLDPSLPTLLYAPTGDKYNSVEAMWEKVISRLAADSRWNLLIKLHDHPKKRKIDWFSILSKYESGSVRLLRDFDVVPYLQAADLLISDASSVATEYTLLDRPIVLLDVPKLIKRGGSAELQSYSTRLGPVVSDPRHVVDVAHAELGRPHRYSSLRRDIAEEVFYKPGTAAFAMRQARRICFPRSSCGSNPTPRRCRCTRTEPSAQRMNTASTHYMSLQALRLLHRFGAPHRRWIAASWIATLLVVACRLAMPWPLRAIIEAASEVGSAGGGGADTPIFRQLLCMIGAYVAITTVLGFVELC